MSTRVEDNDERIKYTGSWSTRGDSTASGGTVTRLHDGASLRLRFEGTRISVYCNIRGSRRGENPLFIIGNAPGQVVVGPFSGPGPCWTSSDLSPQNHELIIQIPRGDTVFELDRIDFIPIETPQPSPQPPASPPLVPPVPPPSIVNSSPPPFPTPAPTVTVTIISNNDPQLPSNSSPNASRSIADVDGAPTHGTQIISSFSSPLANSLVAQTPPITSGAVTTNYDDVFSSLIAAGNTNPSIPSPTPGSTQVPASTESSKAKVVGGVLGTLVSLLLIALIFFFLVKRRKSQQQQQKSIDTGYNNDYDNLPSPSTRVRNRAHRVTPYIIPPSQTRHTSANMWQPTPHIHNPDSSRRPASFSSSMYTDAPPLRDS